VVDRWVNRDSFETIGLPLIAGKPVPIRMATFRDHGNPYLDLSWSSPSLPTELLGPRRLTPPMDFAPAPPARASAGESTS